MGKKILVLTGSPRKGGNSDALADAFTRGAEAKGHTVQRFEAGRSRVAGCLDCGACWSRGKACVQDDDWDAVPALLAGTEALVIVSPVYWFSLTAQIKAAIDRMYAYASSACKTPLAVRESALLMCAGDTDPRVFDGSVATYKSIVDYLRWADRGVLCVPGVMERGDIAAGSGLADAEKLGGSF